MFPKKLDLRLDEQAFAIWAFSLVLRLWPGISDRGVRKPGQHLYTDLFSRFA